MIKCNVNSLGFSGKNRTTVGNRLLLIKFGLFTAQATFSSCFESSVINGDMMFIF